MSARTCRVSIHAPAKGATAKAGPPALRAVLVSIHAPAKGATGLPPLAPVLTQVSIHAPAKGATRGGSSPSTRTTLFRSTPPQRGRPVEVRFHGFLAKFRSTPPQRGRRAVSVTTSPARVFRSTPPQRGRRSPHRLWSRRKSFDPRPRKGGDGLPIPHCYYAAIFLANAKGSVALVPSQPIWRIGKENPTISKSRPRCEPRCKSQHASCSQGQENYRISGPLRSIAGFAPTCSTRRDQFEPR